MAPATLWSKVSNSRGHLVWEGSCNRWGIPTWRDPATQSSVTAHRYLYERNIGAIPPNHYLTIVCGVLCIDPDHLTMRTAGSTLSEAMSARTTCNAGYPFDKIGARGQRACSICERTWGRNKWQRQVRGETKPRWYPEAVAVCSNRTRARKWGVPYPLTVDEWKETLVLNARLCAYCADHGETIDHIVPMAKGGPHAHDNVIPACLSCNMRKHDLSILTFLLNVRAEAS